MFPPGFSLKHKALILVNDTPACYSSLKLPINIKERSGPHAMLIDCPNCRTKYTVSAQSLGTGRTVRCHSCQNTWFQTPADDSRSRLRFPRPQQAAFVQPSIGEPNPYQMAQSQPPYPVGGYHPLPSGLPPHQMYPPQASWSNQNPDGHAAYPTSAVQTQPLQNLESEIVSS